MTENWEHDWKRRERLYEEQLEAYVEMANALRCKVCSKPGQFIRLLGGRFVALCADDINAWNEYLSQHELAGRWNDAQADYYVALIQRNEEIARARNQAWQEITNAIYELSGEWLKEEIVKWIH